MRVNRYLPALWPTRPRADLPSVIGAHRPRSRARRHLTGAVCAIGTCLTAMSAPPAQARPGLVALLDLTATVSGPNAGQQSCASAFSALRSALDGIGIPTQRISARTIDALRVNLARIGAQGATPRMIIACGDGAVSDGEVFLIEGDTPQGDISRRGISADTVARIAGPNGITLLDLHPLPGAALSAPEVDRWRTAAQAGTTRLVNVEAAGEMPMLIQRLTKAAKGDGEPTLAPLFSRATQPIAPPQEEAAPALTAVTTGASASTPAAPTAVVPAAPAEAPAEVPATTTAPGTSGENPASPPAPAETSSTQPEAPAPKPPMPAPTHKHVRKPSPEIRSEQLGLLAAGLYHGTISGFNTRATVNAARKYQKTLGHTVTGHLTPEEQKNLAGG